MSIRGDMEAILWKEVGEDRARDIVDHFFDSLAEADAIMFMQGAGFDDKQIIDFLHILGALKNKCLTHVSTHE